MTKELSNKILAEYLQHLLGKQYKPFLNAKPEPAAIRANGLKSNIELIKNKLENWGVSFTPHFANPDGLVIENDFHPLSHSLAFFRGEFNYQSISSQLPVLVLDPQPGETILDMAASPGSKSTQIAALMKNQGRLILNEVSGRRLRALIANTHRAGLVNDVVLQIPGQRTGTMFPEFFDRVMVDAPCSALGTLPAHFDEINNWWSKSTLTRLANLQFQLLVSAIKAVKVNGVIVYSTCSIAPEENELLIDKILKEYPVEIESVPLFAGDRFKPALNKYQDKELNTELKKAARTYPHLHSMEGFFIVRLKKTDHISINKNKEAVRFIHLYKMSDPDVFPILEHLSFRWGIDLNFFDNFRFYLTKKRIYLINEQWDKIPEQGFIKAGIVLAEKKFQEWKLTNSSVQLLGERIKKSLLELTNSEIKQLFKTGNIELRNLTEGYYIITHLGNFIGCASNFNGKLKMHLPYFFNLLI